MSKAATKTAKSRAKPRAGHAPSPAATPTHAERPAQQRGLQPWVKGQSGNPAGRSRASYRIAELARDHGEAALEKLVSIMHGEKQGDEVPDIKVQADAARTILDRAYGKSQSMREITHELGDKAEGFVAALREIAARPRIQLVEGVVVEEDDPRTDDPPDEPPA